MTDPEQSGWRGQAFGGNDPDIPEWEFQAHGRPRLLSVLFPRPDPGPSFEAAYLETDSALRRMIRRLVDYDANTFRTDP